MFHYCLKITSKRILRRYALKQILFKNKYKIKN